MEELQSVIRELKKICKEADIEVSHDVFLECATKLYNTRYIQYSKDNTLQKSKTTQEPATKKQLETLKKLKIPISNDLTKQEAYQIIKGRLG